MASPRAVHLLCSLALIVGSAACGAGGKAVPRGGDFLPDGGPGTTPIVNQLRCTTARASEDLQPRADLIGAGLSVPGAAQMVHTSDLFVRFYAVCGGCHVDASNGGRHTDRASFATTVDAAWLAAAKSDDPKTFMPPPPNGKPFSMRAAGDPVTELVRYLEAWLSAGRPADIFSVEGGGGMLPAAEGSYAFTPPVAAAMTNLGNCIPEPAAIATSTSGIMESKDQFFATAQALPPNLADTDLTTFDAADLAATGVIAYVPTYPLWSAGSGKLRHVRVPRGQTVQFDKAAQTFHIPANTRFYKTFFRKVVDRTGQLRNRKMETRVIVTRPDRTLPDGTVEQASLFGTYVWSEDELTATLANLPYRDGTPFADQVRTYITDELAYQDVVDSVSVGANFDGALSRALEQRPELQQHYAIPGRIRCVQCHMGSPTGDFVLGFFPLQLARRADKTGGTYEPTGADEVNQLQRLIDYRVISGMTSPADVLPLEQSQGTRKPRTPEELTAQGYMLGNCAHCHNPRGLPSVTKPELRAALNFMPDAKDGGIFELPLDRMSPIRARGANGDIAIPYITPSLRDYPVATDDDLTRIDNGMPISSGDDGELTWTPKYFYGNNNCTSAAKDRMGRAYCGPRRSGFTFVPAPWRSLIYRNVDTPFNYFDDYVPFPHMPMNTPGFDCRAPRIMADWMVGLPAVLKNPQAGGGLGENALPKAGARPGDGTYDSSPQPYAEVKPGEAGYDAALFQAKERLQEYHQGVRYAYCQDSLSPDIYDPMPRGSTGQYLPDPTRYLYGGIPPDDPQRPGEYLQPALGVPYHSHFFSYDPTDPPPPWSPRRPEWKSLLHDRAEDSSLPAGGGQLTDALKRDRRVLVDAINEAQLTEALRAFATTEVPFGLWVAKPECQQKLQAQPKASTFAGAQRPTWLVDHPPPSPDAPVYMSAPGATLYRHICFNCHGPKADGHGLQADALGASSEGEARPANFRDGLFGPVAQPSGNLLATFNIGTPGVDALGWGARYMSWMALGGTLKKIPQDIIHQVEATTVLGQRRQNLHFLPGANAVSANMLNLAKGLCSVILPEPAGHFALNAYQQFPPGQEPRFYPPYNSDDAPFITGNGDKEMWLHLCNDFSPQVVRVYSAVANNSGTGTVYSVDLTALYYADGYPASAPVLDHRRTVQNGVHPDNLYPACLRPPEAAAAAYLADKPIRTQAHMPDCPAAFLSSGKVMYDRAVRSDEMTDNVTRWELRGAIAAGMSVFSYLQAAGGMTMVKPYYNECQALK